jgi:lambda family phage portal protein
MTLWQKIRKALGLSRSYSGAEANRLNSARKPRNLSADSELLGPYGADDLRAWSRQLVRDNAYAWGVVDTIVSSVVGCGIGVESLYEPESGFDASALNEARDKTWREWSEYCDITGQYSFDELQMIVQREIVEAGECLVHMVTVPRDHNGIYRPVPFALELIEADRLAADKDTYAIARTGNIRIVRGVELDDVGRPVGYWIYPDHPNSPYTPHQWAPIRIDARNILHLFRRDRIGQSRGVSWFAPVVSWLRDMGVYLDNELQASAIASCFVAAIKTETPLSMNNVPDGLDAVDADGNPYDYIQPGQILNLRPGESLESANPGRPNSSAEPWIALMLRGIAVGTGLSYEIVARDFSQTNYSSNRASQLEDRRRFRRWQKYLINNLCRPVWDRFCDAAALAGRSEFPTMVELLDDRRKYAGVEFQTPTWEWVDPTAEQSAAENSIRAFQSTYQAELAGKGANWRAVFKQRAKEERLLKSLGLTSPTAEVAATAESELMTAEASMVAASDGDMPESPLQPTGEMSETSTQQFNRNRKAIGKILQELADGEISKKAARVFLSAVGMTEQNIDVLIEDTVNDESTEDEKSEVVEK